MGSQTGQTTASERLDPPPSLPPNCPLHSWLSSNPTTTLTINAGAPAKLPPMAVKLKGETAATKPCGWERNGTSGSVVPPLTMVQGKKGSSRSRGTASHLQPPVDHAVGADVDADGLAALQLQGVLGIESEEVDQLRSSIDLRLDDCFTLPGQVASNKSGEGRAGGEMPQPSAAAVRHRAPRHRLGVAPLLQTTRSLLKEGACRKPPAHRGSSVPALGDVTSARVPPRPFRA